VEAAQRLRRGLVLHRRHEAEARQRLLPALHGGHQVEPIRRAGAPHQRDGAAAGLLHEVVQQRLHRREAGAAGHAQQRRLRFGLHFHVAERQLHLQRVARSELRHQLGELPARDVADVQLQHVAFVRRVGHGVGAAAAVGQRHLQVLPRAELRALAGRQAQLQHVDVGSGQRVAEHLDRVGLARGRVEPMPAGGRDLQVLERQALAEEALVGLDLRGRRRALDAARRDLAGAVAADALAAGVGHLDAGLERGVEHVLPRFAGKVHVGAGDVDVVGHVCIRHPRGGGDPVLPSSAEEGGSPGSPPSRE